MNVTIETPIGTKVKIKSPDKIFKDTGIPITLSKTTLKYINEIFYIGSIFWCDRFRLEHPDPYINKIMSTKSFEPRWLELVNATITDDWKITCRRMC